MNPCKTNEDYPRFKNSTKRAIEEMIKNRKTKEWIRNRIIESFKTENIQVAMIKNDIEFRVWLNNNGIKLGDLNETN